MRNKLAFALYLYIIIWVLELIRIFLFQSNIENLVTKLKLKLGSFIGRKKKSSFLLQAWKCLISAMLLT